MRWNKDLGVCPQSRWKASSRNSGFDEAVKVLENYLHLDLNFLTFQKMKIILPFIVTLLATFWSIEASSQGCEPVTFDGYTYDVVQIGDQCWFAENLRTEHYANGDAIPGGWSNEEWAYLNVGATAVYNETYFRKIGRKAKIKSNLNAYGRLYNWYAVNDSRGLCPTGWHVPTDEEWMTLEMELGMSEYEANSKGDRGTDQGTQMKSSPSDDPSWDGTNTSGFSALAGGFRDYDGFYGEWDCVGFWSSSPGGTDAWYRLLGSGYAGVGRYLDNQRYGNSVRCVRDE